MANQCMQAVWVYTAKLLEGGLPHILFISNEAHFGQSGNQWCQTPTHHDL